MPILVTGATGLVGRLVVDGLLARGVQVRALTRTPDSADLPPGVEVVAGDLTSPDHAPGLFEGVTSVFLFPAEGGISSFIAFAAAAGVQHFVVLSSLAAAHEHPRDQGSWSSEHHRSVEAAVAATGVGSTVLRPGSFAKNLLFWSFPIRQFGGVQGPYPTSAQAPVHEADVADLAVAALTDPAHRGHTYVVTGPEALTRVDQLNAIGHAIGRELTFQETTPDEFAASMAQFLPQPAIRMLLDYWSDTVAEPDLIRSVASITGAAPRTLAQWASEHADQFR